jgi:hypothetical protein
MMATLTIPNGWTVVNNPDQRLLDGAAASHSNRFVTTQGEWRWVNDTSYSGFEMLEQVDKVGEPVAGHSSGAAIRMNQDGIGYARNRSGVVISTVKVGYFSFWEPLPGFETHDICTYCGSSNGAASEYRIGYDCCVCGSN